jgi:hypothetical protein
MSNKTTTLLEAKEWLRENPTESAVTAARIYKINVVTLRSSISQDKSATTIKKIGGQNKVLTKAQTEAIKQWIRNQCEQGLGATKKMTFAAICYLRKPEPPPSQSWLNKFIKNELQDFHMIKTKPISQQRVAAQDSEVIRKWFCAFQQFYSNESIKGENIWNMDETGFRIGIPGGQKVIVPCNVTELYTTSPENRISITVIESVSSISIAIAPVIIIPGKMHMESWYHDNLHGNELILLSDTGYTNDELAMIWLDHFIKETKSDIFSEWKVIILDSHTSHTTPELRLKAATCNIHLYSLPSHLTHVLQPLDVGIFQPYKHWHQEAVHTAIRNLDLSYTISSFIRDLPLIRANTFKELTITHAFTNSGIWPIDVMQALKQLQKYAKPITLLNSTSQQQPTTLKDSEIQLQQWNAKIPLLLSSPSRQRYENFISGTEQVLATAQLQELDLKIIQRQVEEQRKQKAISKRTLQKGGHLTVEEARDKIEQKAELITRKASQKAARESKKLQRAVTQDLHKAGVIARKAERHRKKRVAMLTKAGANIPDEIIEPIVDPEASTHEENEGYESKSNSEDESYNESNDGNDSDYGVIIVESRVARV